MKILVSGGSGFVGSAFIRNYLHNHQNDEVVNLDSLTIGSNLNNLKEVEQNWNYQFVKDDIRNQNNVERLAKDVDIIVNFAAESHVDKSIGSGFEFVNTNVLGTTVLLEMLKKYPQKRFLQVGTDEVYGSIDHGS